ncbi:MAG: Nif3-like dinuclear metal center hexameric protein [Propionibacteriaceae bacterium]|nr:Nif3-like dinuclear metal center hexameric protein [Propionibacteriaceae bacterium]
MTCVRDIVGWLEDAYPPALAEDWDRVGLSVGDPEAAVTDVLFAVEVTDAVVAQAIEVGAELIVAHHPLLLRGVHAVRVDEPKGRVVTALIRAGIAAFSAHTNADSAEGGVADCLADVLSLTDRRPLTPATAPPTDKLVTFVPAEHVDALVTALSAAGAGTIGGYDGCAFTSTGEGRYTPGVGTRPLIGAVGTEERTPEVRIEMVLPRACRGAVVTALRGVHPYDEPAYDVYPLASEASARGLGRIGRLPAPLPARAVAGLLADAVPAGVDCYVTGDLRHHPAQDFLAHADAPALIDVPHWAAEWLWLPAAERVLAAAASEAGVTITSTISRINTDPWALRLP